MYIMFPLYLMLPIIIITIIALVASLSLNNILATASGLNELSLNVLSQSECTKLLIMHPVNIDDRSIEVVLDYTFCPNNLSLYYWVLLNCELKMALVGNATLCPPGAECLIVLKPSYVYVCPYFPPSPLETATLCVKPWGPIDEDDRLEVLIETGSIVNVEKENYEATLKYWANISSVKLHALTTIVHEPQSMETDLEPAIIVLPNKSKRPEITLGEQYDIVLFSGHGGDLLIVYSEPSSEQSVNPLLKRIIPNATIQTPKYWGTSSVRLYYVNPLGFEESTYWGYGDTEWVILNACNSLNLSDALKITGIQTLSQLLEIIGHRVFMGTIEYDIGKRLFDVPHPANMYLHGILGWTTTCDWPLCGDVPTKFLQQLANNITIGKAWLSSLQRALDELEPSEKRSRIGKVYGLGIISLNVSTLTENRYTTYDYSDEEISLAYRDPAWIYYDACKEGSKIRITIYFKTINCSINVTYVRIPRPPRYYPIIQVSCEPPQIASSSIIYYKEAT